MMVLGIGLVIILVIAGLIALASADKPRKEK